MTENSSQDLQGKNFFRYPKIWLSLLRNCFLRQSEFKLDFVGRLLVELVWIGTQIVFYKSTFQFVSHLGSWSEADIWFFVATLILVDSLNMIFFHDNINRFGQVIKLGLLDFYLLYPLSLRFLCLLRFVNVVSIVNIFCGIGVMIYALNLLPTPLSVFQILTWFLYTGLGALMIGLLASCICAVAFWTTQSTNLVWFFYELYRLAHRPENLYAPWLRRILLSAFPAAFFISIPVQLTLKKLDTPFWFIAPFLVLGALLLISKILWTNGVKRYEGALS